MRFDLTRLARTPLYREAWAGRVPTSLADAPPLTGSQWRRHVHEQAGRSLLGEPAVWVLYSVPGDDSIWMPLGPQEMETGAAEARSMLRNAGIRPGDVVLAVPPPAPWAGNTLPYLFSSTDSLVPNENPTGVEVFPLSVATVEYKPDLTVFPLSREPTVVVGTRDEVEALLALAQRAGLPRPRFRLALIVTSTVVEPATSLSESTATLLYVPGLFAPAGGRPDVAGVWLPPGTVHADLIADEEWGKNAQDPSRVPTIRAAAQSVGSSGELVVTVSNSVLPIIRLRTSLRIRVAEVDPAGGVRIEVLNRLAPRTRDTTAAFAPRR